MSTYRTLRAGVFLPPFHPNDEDPLLCIERDFQLPRAAIRFGACRRRNGPGSGSADGKLRVAGLQLCSSSAFLLSESIRPSMPLVRKVCANSDLCVASSLIAPER